MYSMNLELSMSQPEEERPVPMSAFKPDLLIRDITGKPIAAVEVKSRDRLPTSEATEIRREMLGYGLPMQIPYFLLLSQDDGYLWKGSEQPGPDSPPLYHFPMDRVIRRYSPKNPQQRLYETELELLILHWLANLIARHQETTEEPEKTLAQAGFNASIQDGVVLIEEAL
jgi:hypothetical protein